MLKVSWIALLVIGLLLSATGFADDDKPSSKATDTPTVATVMTIQLLLKSEYASRQQPSVPFEPLVYSDDRSQSFDNLYFRDASVLDRVSKLRSLSLLTLAETGQTRLFLGVNEEGLFGVHFRAFPRHGGEHYLEFARMPYLRKADALGEVEQSGSKTD